MNQSQEPPPSDVPARTPRRIRLKPAVNPGCGIWFMRLFILPHTLIGLGLVGWVFVNIALLVAGTNTQGEVVRKYMTTGEEGATNHHVEYVYGPDKRFRGHSTVSSAEYNQIALPRTDQIEKDVSADSPQSHLPVRYIAAGRLDYSQPLKGSWGVWGILGFSILFCVFWNGILSIFFYMAWIGPYVGRKLYEHGKVSRGRITGKRIVSGKPRRLSLKYEFQTESGETVKGSMTASERSTAKADAYVGQAITVLYRPDRPRKSLIYEYGNYEVLSP